MASIVNIKGKDDDISVIKDKMKANSQAWAGADAATKDALHKANLDLGQSIGSTYNSRSGTWANNATKGTGGISTESASSNEDMLTSMARAQEAQRIAALKRSVDATVAGYESDISNIPKQYQPLKDQTEVNRYTSERALKESLANSGQTAAGFGRTETLNLHTGQNNELSAINATEQGAVDKLKLAIRQARESQSQEELSIKAGTTGELMKNLYNERLRAASQEKQDFASTIGAYGEDFQAEINRLLAAGVPEDDIKIKMLKASRVEKKSNLAAAQAELEQRAFENWLAQQKNSRENAETSYSVNKPYYKPGYKSTGTKKTRSAKPKLTAAQALSSYNKGMRTKGVITAMDYWYETNLATETTETGVSKEAYDRYRTAMGRLVSNKEKVKYLEKNQKYINEATQNKLMKEFGLV